MQVKELLNLNTGKKDIRFIEMDADRHEIVRRWLKVNQEYADNEYRHLLIKIQGKRYMVYCLDNNDVPSIVSNDGKIVVRGNCLICKVNQYNGGFRLDNMYFDDTTDLIDQNTIDITLPDYKKQPVFVV